MNKMFRRINQGVIAACVAISSGAFANDPVRDTLYFQSPPEVGEIARQLFGERTRGLVINDNASQSVRKTPANSLVTVSENQTSTEKSVGLPVLFHFGKTTLVESSKPYLDKIGELMLQPRFQKETLIIEGHTDAVGSIAHNDRLSELRALAVKQYLVAQYGIDPLRLFPLGKGENQLFDPTSPNAKTNRRVEFLRYQR